MVKISLSLDIEPLVILILQFSLFIFNFSHEIRAFYLFVKAPNGDAVAYSEKAKLDHNLLVVPGDGFACPVYFRLSYCVSNDMIKRSLPAFKAMIESYK